VVLHHENQNVVDLRKTVAALRAIEIRALSRRAAAEPTSVRRGT
jgi:hypothetical protein